MKEQLITVETALVARHKGCKIHTPIQAYSGDNIPLHPQSLIQRWLREEYYIDVFIEPILDNGVLQWQSCSRSINKNNPRSFEPILSTLRRGFNNYEDALEEGLFTALKYI